jgi:hypothetical protein
VFAEQALTSESWYRGHDPKAAEGLMKEMIKMSLQGLSTLDEIMELQVKKIQQTVKRN